MRPLTDPADGTFYQSTRKGSVDGVLMILDLAGDLTRSTYYGGEGDEIVTAITEDEFDNVYFFGVTDSETGTEDNCQSPATGLPLCDLGGDAYFQDENAGDLDVFIARMDEGFYLNWATFYGGTNDDRVYDCDYFPSSTPFDSFIAFVGSSFSSLPFVTTVGYQLNGSGEAGYTVMFNAFGKLNWWD